MLNEVKHLARIGVWELDLVRNELTWTDEIFELFEIDKARFGASYEAFLEAVHPEDLEMVNWAYTNSLQTREPYHIEHRLLMPDGRIKRVVEACRTYYDEAGTPLLSLGIVQDITERKRVERQALESEGRLKILIEHTPAIVWSTDEHLNFTSLAGNALSLENRAHRFEGRSLGAFFSEATDEIYSAHRRALEGNASVIDLQQNGCWYHASIEPLRTSGERIEGCIGVALDVTERKSKEILNWRKANFDPLTGLPNRSLFMDRLKHALHSAHRRGEEFALFFMDLDGFKGINDRLGHEAGDELLRQVARRLSRKVRESDTVARLAGDEFVIITQPIEHTTGVLRLADKLVQALCDPYELAGETCHDLGCSCGIAIYPKDGAHEDELMRHADAAMYRAKKDGCNRKVLFDPSMVSLAATRRQHRQRMLEAIDGGEFTIHFQPRFDTRLGEIIGAEALLRWQQPGKSLLMPMQFIGELEDAGLISRLGEKVLAQACEQLGKWHAQGFGDLHMAINISQRQLWEMDLAATIENVLATSEVPAGKIYLEVSERALSAQMPGTEQRLHDIGCQGVHLTLDDFGSGYSCLNYLQRLSIDGLKIDRSFVSKIPGDPHTEDVVRAIAGVGRSMHFTLEAEGIETLDQLHFMRDLGCRCIQGYLLGSPVNAKAFTQLLHQGHAAASAH